MDIKIRTGEEGRFRFLPETARGGFLLSPVVTDRAVFALLNSTQWRDQIGMTLATDFRIRAETESGRTASYQPEFDIQFSRLAFPRADLSAVPGLNEYLAFSHLLSRIQVVETEGQVKRVHLATGSAALLTPALTRALLPVPQGASSVRLGFGMLPESYREPDPAKITDGVEFRVYGAVPNADGRLQVTLLWSRKLDPAAESGDRPPQSIEIQLPSPPPPGLLLETVPGPLGKVPLSYWTGAQFR
jgi:hypothetical protein